jgi:hypothetical protein
MKMKTRLQYIILIFFILALLWQGLSGLKEEQTEPVVYNIPPADPKPAIFPKWKDEENRKNGELAYRIPRIGKDFVGFKEALAFNESGRRYNIVNTLGFMGKYQFGISTLRALKLNVTHKEFLNNPRLQEEAFKRYVEENRRILAKEIEKYNGRYINGIKITESGILAAANLAGAGAVKKFLHSGGKISSTDAFGTRIEDYLRKFSGYRLDDKGNE